ncbi:JmjC domain-containing protein [Micromonospora sp. DT62]|uniref:JmjC domain-containing protein n=1 Tax=Micromonospora sp. DT62 TaxID=3416521 RepID=UPI003CF840CA
MSESDRLVPLLDDDFMGSRWGRDHVIWRGATDPTTYIGLEEINARLDASLLRWPYFTLLRHGEQPPVHTYTSRRDVIGHKRDGFPEPAAIRRLMADGASLKLNQLADWHRPTRALRDALETVTSAAVQSYVFWTPAEQRGMLPHRDAAHVIAIQLVGRKEWHLYAEPGQVASTAGLDVDASKPSHTFVLEPGDVLYLPHGWPHDAVASGGESMHLTFTLTEPSPEDLVEALVQRFTTARTDLVHRHHARSLESKTREVRTALRNEAQDLASDEWVGLALAAMRKR